MALQKTHIKKTHLFALNVLHFDNEESLVVKARAISRAKLGRKTMVQELEHRVK